MSYKNYLREKIKELKLEIETDKGEIEILKKELRDLEMKEFEEDLREEGNNQLLKGQCCLKTTASKSTLESS